VARKNSSAFEDVVVIVSYFPWWVGVILAVVAYLLLQPYVHMEIPQIKGPGAAGAMATSSLTKMFATVGQYVLPILFLLGSAISFFKRKKREHLFEESAQARDAAALNDPSWQEFEMLVGEAFRRKGYAVRETGGGGADGGVDLAISKDNKTIWYSASNGRRGR
jgi:restriction system protein